VVGQDEIGSQVSCGESTVPLPQLAEQSLSLAIEQPAGSDRSSAPPRAPIGRRPCRASQPRTGATDVVASREHFPLASAAASS